MASLQSQRDHTCAFSAGVSSRENIATSTAPEMQSVNPLPAPPDCISKRTSGCVFLYSAAHSCAKGYNEYAPEKEIETVVTSRGEGSGLPSKLITNASIAINERRIVFFIQIVF